VKTDQPPSHRASRAVLVLSVLALGVAGVLLVVHFQLIDRLVAISEDLLNHARRSVAAGR
jgi:hypothetical protein